MLLRSSFFLLLAGSLCASTAFAEDVSNAGKALRVCADPNNLPFSNKVREGFENKLADLVAADLGEKVEYTWWAQRRGNIRNTLKARTCDVIMGVPADLRKVETTRPYYRSTYVFVSRAGSGDAISSLKDARLRSLTIGIQLIGDNGFNTPPSHALTSEGIVNNLRGYTVYGDYRQANPPARIVEAVRDGEVDIAAVWGPLAGYFASRGGTPLVVTPVSDPDDFPGLRFQFDIAMGVRKGDEVFKSQLNAVIERRHPEITALLKSYGVPLIENEQALSAASMGSPHRNKE